MHLAATQRSLRGISLLLANGASINARDGKGRTPLHAACASFHDKGNGSSSGESDIALLECVELLLSSGALDDARDINGQTALHLSALAGNLSAARALLAAGATAVADDAGNSPLHLAAAQGHSDVIQLLVTVGNRDESSWDPLPLAPTSSPNLDVREQGLTSAVVGEAQLAFDVELSAHGRGLGAVLSGPGRSEPTGIDRETFDDDNPATPIVPTHVQHLAARDNHSNLTMSSTENVAIDDFHSGYGAGGAYRVNNRRSWGETSSRKAVPNDQDGIHRDVEARWQGRGHGNRDGHTRLFESPIENANRIGSEDDDGMEAHLTGDPKHHHRLRSHGKEGRRNSSSRQPRYRSGGDLDDRAMCWPEPLPAHEYEQVSASTDK